MQTYEHTANWCFDSLGRTETFGLSQQAELKLRLEPFPMEQLGFEQIVEWSIVLLVSSVAQLMDNDVVNVSG